MRPPAPRSTEARARQQARKGVERKRQKDLAVRACIASCPQTSSSSPPFVLSSPPLSSPSHRSRAPLENRSKSIEVVVESNGYGVRE